MRERHNLMNVPAIKPTLEAVRHQFETWRKRKRSRDRVSRTGERSAAVGRGPDFRFVRLDPGSSMIASEWVVEMEARSGTRMRMTFKGSPGELDPMELSRVFWRQGG